MNSDINDRIDQGKIAGLIKKDKTFRESLGIKNDHTILKRVSILLGIWILILFVTPLPQNMLMGRVGIFSLFLIAAIAWGVDIFAQKINIEDAAESLTKIFKKDPKVQLFVDPETEETIITHGRFQAKCSTLSQLQFKSMLDVENEVKEAMESLLPPKGEKLFQNRRGLNPYEITDDISLGTNHENPRTDA